MKKQKQQKPKELEKANAEIETPRNIDFVEISMTHENLDKIAQKNAQLLNQRNDPILRKHTVRRQEKLIRKVFKVASQVLTDIQFNVFVHRYIYNLPETEIAMQLGCHQTNITGVLKNSIKKIQKRLRIPISLKDFSRSKKEDK